MSTDVIRFETAADLRALAEPFLMEHEAEHNLILGLLDRLERIPDFYASKPYFAAVEADRRVVCAAVMTPPFPLVVSRCEAEDAPRLLAADLYAFDPRASGVNAESALARSVAEAWQAISGELLELRLRERIYKLEHVKEPPGVEGAVRPATEADVDLLTDWRIAFAREAIPWEEAPWEATRAQTLRMLGAPPDVAATLIWEVNEQPVCMVGYSSPTPNSLRVAPVYTPPEFRRRGYASACTAAACLEVLARGKPFVTLFADLANQTSNHVYRSIGFRAVCDVDVYYFGGR
jgi:predicted GNAT family acetyltransferase